MRPQLCVASVLVLALGSCASVMTGSHDIIAVNSSPSGARFTTDTGASGTTPAKVEVPDDVDIRFTFEMDGFQKTEILATKHVSGWVWGNILLGGIIGLIIDVASGGMHTHDDAVQVTLVPITP